MMLRTPGITAIALIALGLGIGANTAVFTVLNSVLLRPLPYPESHRLMLLSHAPQGGFFGPMLGVVESDYLEFRDRNQAFEGIATFSGAQVSLTGAGEPVRLPAANVTSAFFDVLRIKPVIGPGFHTGATDQVILGDAIWRSRFRSDSNIIGKKIQLDGVPHTVAGVMPPGLRFPSDADLWTQFEVRINPHNAFFRPVVGRLKPGWSAAQAYGEFTAILRALHPVAPGQKPRRNAPVAKIMPLKELLVGDIRSSLRIFAGAVAFVLLIACANVANLLLMRAESRRQEIAVRIALGAARQRLVRQLLTESLLLGLIGGALGILISLWGVPALLALAPQGRIPRLTEIHIDAAVLAFTLAASFVTGLLFGAAPAIQAARHTVRDSLTRNSTIPAGRSRLRSSLVIAEVALAVVLLSGAGLMIKTLWRLHAVDPGFQTENLLAMSVDIPAAVYKQPAAIQAFHARVLEKLSTVPGADGAGAISGLPLTGFFPRGNLQVEGGRFPDNYVMDKLVISENYFRAMGIRLLQGRDLSDRDTADAPRVAMLSRSAATTLWPGQDPVGKRISETDHPTAKSWYTIVGVVDDVRQDRLTAPPDHAVYFPFRQSPNDGWLLHMTYVTRQSTPELRIAPSLRAAVHAVDPNMPITQFTTMQDLIATTGAERTFQARLLSAFATLALLLALIGIYGIAAYAVAMRTREIGIRMALGARAADVVRLVLLRTIVLCGGGLVLGMGGSLYATRALEKMLFEVKPHDPATMAGVGAVLAATALVAAWFPARRAARVDPLVALRWE
jgi:putative ABC transport system permease protein